MSDNTDRSDNTELNALNHLNRVLKSTLQAADQISESLLRSLFDYLLAQGMLKKRWNLNLLIPNEDRTGASVTTYPLTIAKKVVDEIKTYAKVPASPQEEPLVIPGAAGITFTIQAHYRNLGDYSFQDSGLQRKFSYEGFLTFPSLESVKEMAAPSRDLNNSGPLGCVHCQHKLSSLNQLLTTAQAEFKEQRMLADKAEARMKELESEQRCLRFLTTTNQLGGQIAPLKSIEWTESSYNPKVDRT